MITEGDYQQAVQFPRFRQSFLDRIDLEEAAKYVKRVNYKSTTIPPSLVLSNSGPTLMMTVRRSFFLTYLWFRPLSTVFVFPRSFSIDVHHCLDDFLSTLIDHEGHHARQFYERDKKSAVAERKECYKLWDVASKAAFHQIGTEDERDRKWKNGWDYLENIVIRKELEAHQNQKSTFVRRKCTDDYMKSVNENIAYYESCLKRVAD